MKKINLTLFFVLFVVAGYAQDNYSELVRSALKVEKKALIAEVMELNAAEGNVFWPVYNDYERELYAINTNYLALITDFANNFENLSDKKATELLTAASKIHVEKVQLEKTYIKKMLKILSPQKTVRFFQATNKINIMVDAKLASEIPILENIE